MMFWGSAFVLIALILPGLSPFFITGVRIICGAATLYALALALSGPLPRTREFWGWSALIGTFSVILSFTSYTWAQQHVPSGVVSIYIAATPLFVILLSRLMTDERAARAQTVGFIIGFLGVIFLIGPQTLSSFGADLAYEAAALFAAVAFAMSSTLVRRAPKYDPLHIAAGSVTAAAVIYLPLTIWTAPAAIPGWSVLGVIFILGAANSAVSQAIRIHLIRRAGAIFTSQATFLLPVWALFLGWLILGETLSRNDAIGFALILTGVAIAEFARKRV
ncbi:MAG: DMT family transporter [Pseudomonadota bacterium]